MTPEICICAAWQTEEGITFRGHRHSDARNAALAGFCRPLREQQAQGFITSLNRFVGREEGLRLQLASGIGSRNPSGYRGDQLYSEDLY